MKHKSRWLTVCDDARGSVKLEFYRGCAFLHLVLRLPMQGLRDVKASFPALRSWLKRMGHNCVYVLIDQGNDKLYRFQRLLGFSDVWRRKGQILMRQEC